MSFDVSSRLHALRPPAASVQTPASFAETARSRAPENDETSPGQRRGDVRAWSGSGRARSPWISTLVFPLPRTAGHGDEGASDALRSAAPARSTSPPRRRSVLSPRSRGARLRFLSRGGGGKRGKAPPLTPSAPLPSRARPGEPPPHGRPRGACSERALLTQTHSHRCVYTGRRGGGGPADAFNASPERDGPVTLLIRLLLPAAACSLFSTAAHFLPLVPRRQRKERHGCLKNTNVSHSCIFTYSVQVITVKYCM